jgi:predicted kinase
VPPRRAAGPAAGARSTVLGAVSQVVLLINGPAGVGKSSIASRIALRAPNGACIAGDDLKRFVVNRAEPPTVELGLTYVGAAALTDVFLTAGYDLVVVDFIFEHPRHVQRYTEALKAPVQILALTLWAPLDVVQCRHRQRDRPGPDRDSATRSWHALAGHLDELGAVIDARGTIEQTLAATVDHIEQHRRAPGLPALRSPWPTG